MLLSVGGELVKINFPKQQISCFMREHTVCCVYMHGRWSINVEALKQSGGVNKVCAAFAFRHVCRFHKKRGGVKKLYIVKILSEYVWIRMYLYTRVASFKGYRMFAYLFLKDTHDRIPKKTLPLLKLINKFGHTVSRLFKFHEYTYFCSKLY